MIDRFFEVKDWMLWVLRQSVPRVIIYAERGGINKRYGFMTYFQNMNTRKNRPETRRLAQI